MECDGDESHLESGSLSRNRPILKAILILPSPSPAVPGIFLVPQLVEVQNKPRQHGVA